MISNHKIIVAYLFMVMIRPISLMLVQQTKYAIYIIKNDNKFKKMDILIVVFLKANLAIRLECEVQIALIIISDQCLNLILDRVIMIENLADTVQKIKYVQILNCKIKPEIL